MARREGEWMYYDVRGNNTERKLFKDGNYEGDNTVYHQGKVYYVNTYKNDVLVKATYFDPAGKVISQLLVMQTVHLLVKHITREVNLLPKVSLRKGNMMVAGHTIILRVARRSEFVYVDGASRRCNSRIFQIRIKEV